jgi:hypothetical protein
MVASASAARNVLAEFNVDERLVSADIASPLGLKPATKSLFSATSICLLVCRQDNVILQSSKQQAISGVRHEHCLKQNWLARKTQECAMKRILLLTVGIFFLFFRWCERPGP